MPHPRRTVKVTTSPSVEPVTLGEVKAWAKIDSADDDALLTALIAAAREAAENFLRRSLITQSIRITLDLACSGLDDMLGEGVYDLPSSVLFGELPRVIELPRGPIQSITSVTTYDTSNTSSTYSSSNYRLNSDGSRMVLNETAVWPSPLRPVGGCEILCVAGYGSSASDVPQGIRNAILMHIQRMYDGRIVCDMPEGCMRLLKPYRIMDSLAHG